MAQGDDFEEAKLPRAILKLSSVEPGQYLAGRPALKLSNVEPGQYSDGRPVSHPRADRAQYCLTSVRGHSKMTEVKQC